MSLSVYIRKEYFRAVDLKDKSAHILEFHYSPKVVDVLENGFPVFHMEYIMGTKTKVNIVEFYLMDFGLRGKGYGTVCMNEITDQFRKKGITLITAPTGYRSVQRTDGRFLRENWFLPERKRRYGDEDTGLDGTR